MLMEMMAGRDCWPDLRGRADLVLWKLDLKDPTDRRQREAERGEVIEDGLRMALNRWMIRGRQKTTIKGVVGAELRWGKTTKN